jgi:tetratricopeptide (TPR) repeat protein
MKKIVLLFFMALISIACFAQQPKSKTDSILNLLSKHSQKDTIRVNLLIDAFNTKFTEVPDTTIIKLANQALDISTGIHYQKGISNAYRAMGIYYQYLSGDLKKATSYYYKVLYHLNQIKDPKLKTWKELTKASMFANIGTINNDMGNFKKAIEMYNQFSLVYKRNKIPIPANYYVNQGNAHTDLKDYDKAIYFFKEGIEVAKKNNLAVVEAAAWSNLSLCLLRDGQKEQALIAINNSLSQNKILKNDFVSTSSLLNAAMIYAEFKDLDKAEEFGKQAIELSRKINYSILERNSLLTLYEIYVMKNDFKSALTKHLSYINLRDSIFNIEKQADLVKKEVEYKSDQKQLLAMEEIKYQKTIRNYSLFGGLILILAAIGIFIFYKKHRDSVQKQNELVYKAKVADTDMRILRLQMNPHFIFNSLNSISDYISKNDIQTADYYLSKFAKLMRGILENSEEKEIPLEDELKMLELYMQLEGSRLKTKFTYEIKISDDVNPKITMIPPLILQPFVENSIWHGLAGKDGGGKITIEVTRDNTLLNCIVEDNGVGRKGAKPTVGKSYGMKITKDRIELLNKLKNSNASVNLIDLEKGTRVEVKLPFETEA